MRSTKQLHFFHGLLDENDGERRPRWGANEDHVRENLSSIVACKIRYTKCQEGSKIRGAT